MRHLAKQRDASFFVLFFKTCQYGVLTMKCEAYTEELKIIEIVLTKILKKYSQEIRASFGRDDYSLKYLLGNSGYKKPGTAPSLIFAH